MKGSCDPLLECDALCRSLAANNVGKNISACGNRDKDGASRSHGPIMRGKSNPWKCSNASIPYALTTLYIQFQKSDHYISSNRVLSKGSKSRHLPVTTIAITGRWHDAIVWTHAISKSQKIVHSIAQEIQTEGGSCRGSRMEAPIKRFHSKRVKSIRIQTVGQSNVREGQNTLTNS
eukprot:scaffold63115_cov44-Attheya_sp.AAC.1